MRRMGTTMGRAAGIAAFATVLGGFASGLAAQDLADFDYEDLTFRGLGIEAGYIWPTRVEAVETFGVRIDLRHTREIERESASERARASAI